MSCGVLSTYTQTKIHYFLLPYCCSYCNSIRSCVRTYNILYVIIIVDEECNWPSSVNSMDISRQMLGHYQLEQLGYSSRVDPSAPCVNHCKEKGIFGIAVSPAQESESLSSVAVSCM